MTLERADETNAGMHKDGKEREGIEDAVSFMPGKTGVVQRNNSFIHGIARSRASAEGAWRVLCVPCYSTVLSNTRIDFAAACSPRCVLDRRRQISEYYLSYCPVWPATLQVHCSYHISRAGECTMFREMTTRYFLWTMEGLGAMADGDLFGPLGAGVD